MVLRETFFVILQSKSPCYKLRSSLFWGVTLELTALVQLTVISLEDQEHYSLIALLVVSGEKGCAGVKSLKLKWNISITTVLLWHNYTSNPFLLFFFAFSKKVCAVHYSVYPQICCDLLSECQKTLWSQIVNENSMLPGFLCIHMWAFCFFRDTCECRIF